MSSENELEPSIIDNILSYYHFTFSDLVPPSVVAIVHFCMWACIHFPFFPFHDAVMEIYLYEIMNL